MRAVHIGVGHDDDLVIAGLGAVEILANAAAQRRNQRLNLRVAEHAVQACALHIQNLAAQGQNGLVGAVAALLRRAPRRNALDQKELALRRIALLAIRQLARQAVVGERALAARQVARFARRRTGARRVHYFGDDGAGSGRILLQMVQQFLVEKALHQPAHLGGAELGLGLPLEFGLGELHRYDRGESLPDIVAADGFRQLARRLALRALFLLRGDMAVQRPGKRSAETDEMRAALHRIDIVCEGKHILVVGIVVLHCDFNGYRLAARFAGNALFSRQADGRRVQWCTRAGQVLDEGCNAAFKTEVVLLAAALVADGDAHTGVQKGELAQPLAQCVERELRALLENLGVGVEGDLCARVAGLAGFPQRCCGVAALKALAPNFAAEPHLEFQPLAQRIHHRNADAVQPAGHLVCLLVELAAGVQGGENHLGGRALLGGVLVHRNAPAIVAHRDGAIVVDCDLDFAAETGQRLVNGVIHHLIDKVVESIGPGGADVHGRPLAHRVEALENLDGTGVVTHPNLSAQPSESARPAHGPRAISRRSAVPRPALRGAWA